MPDERLIERYFEQVMDGIVGLTRQVARVAYALETNALKRKSDCCACHVCRSLFQTKGTTHCLACGEEMNHG